MLSLCTHCFADADFTGSLSNRHQHYIHNTDTAYKKRDRGNTCKKQGHRICHIIHCVKYIGLIAYIIGLFVTGGLQ